MAMLPSPHANQAKARTRYAAICFVQTSYTMWLPNPDATYGEAINAIVALVR